MVFLSSKQYGVLEAEDVKFSRIVETSVSSRNPCFFSINGAVI